MVVGVTFLLLIWLLNPAANVSTEPETATVTESMDSDNEEDSGTDAEETQIEKDTFAENNTDVYDFLGSFDENELEEESGDVQSGIDLLNNPLQ